MSGWRIGTSARSRSSLKKRSPAGTVRWRYDDERATDVLTAWIHQLALCAQPHPDGQPVTRSVTRQGTRTYPVLGADEAKEHLGRLLAWYREGLARPVHFFPKSAWALLQDGWPAARQKWSGGNSEFGGERDHAAYQLALRGVADPLDGEFEESAHAVFGGIPGDWLPHASAEEQA